jgi:hypothetical protein
MGRRFRSTDKTTVSFSVSGLCSNVKAPPDLAGRSSLPRRCQLSSIQTLEARIAEQHNRKCALGIRRRPSARRKARSASPALAY